MTKSALIVPNASNLFVVGLNTSFFVICLDATPSLHALADLIRLTNELQSRGIELESLTGKIETASPTGKLVFHVFGALSEFERNLIRERTMAGLKAARARGRKGGRPRKLQAKEIKTIRALLKTAEISVQEVATRFGVSRSTLYRNKLA
jgi:DNA invertase Pin-like site-specific DNA recombinase